METHETFKCHVCRKEFDQYGLELHFVTNHDLEEEEEVEEIIIINQGLDGPQQPSKSSQQQVQSQTSIDPSANSQSHPTVTASMASLGPPGSSAMSHMARPGIGSNDLFAKPVLDMQVVHQQMLQQRQQEQHRMGWLQGNSTGFAIGPIQPPMVSMMGGPYFKRKRGRPRKNPLKDPLKAKRKYVRRKPLPNRANPMTVPSHNQIYAMW